MRLLLAAASLVLLVPLAFAEKPRVDNVILISIDALRPDRVGKVVDGKTLTPNLDKLASESVFFEGAVAQAPWTLPSMTTLFTSVYPHRHGVTNRLGVWGVEGRETVRLSSSIVTLAETLRDHGFATAAFTGDAGLDSEFGFARGFGVYFDSVRFAGFETTGPKALAWLKEHGRGRFFLFVHGYDAHAFGPTPEPYPDATRATRARYDELRRRSIENGPVEATDAERALWSEACDHRVASADLRVAKLLEGIRAVPGLLDRTAVVLISDHGDELLDHGRVDHGMDLYDEILRVVLMFRVPGAAPRRVAGQVRLMDVAPTVLDVLGVSDARFSKQAQGTSLKPVLTGAPPPKLDSVAETDYFYRSSKRALRLADGRKLILDLDTLGTELYDLRADPRERSPLKAPPGDVAALTARLRALLDLPPVP